MAYADGDYGDLWENSGVLINTYVNEVTRDDHGSGALYFCDLDSCTSAVSEFGFAPTSAYHEFGSYDPTETWMWRGTVTLSQ